MGKEGEGDRDPLGPPASADSPWAHDVPAPPPPEFDRLWDVRSAAGGGTDGARPPTGTDPGGARGPDREAGEQTDDGDSDAVARRLALRRRAWSIGLGVAGAAVLTIGVLVFVGGESPGEGATTKPPSDVTTSTSPDPDDEPPPAVGELPPSVVDTTTSTAPPDDESASGSGTSTGGGSGEPIETVGPWEIRRFEVPEELATMAPTEVLVVTRDSRFHQIDLPAGTIRSADVMGHFSGTNLIVGDRAAVLHNPGQRTATLVPVDGEPMDIDVPGDTLQIAWRPGRADFVVTEGDRDGIPVEEWSLGIDGSLTRIFGAPMRDHLPWRRAYDPNGQLLVAEVGGTYRVDDNGDVSRISTGLPLGAGRNHILLRECSETLHCTTVLQSMLTGDRIEVRGGQLGPYAQFDQWAAEVAPDGSAAAAVEWTQRGPLTRVVDLVTGDVMTTRSTFDVHWTAAWASDSSGLFAVGLDGDLVFVDRATRSEVEIDFGRGFDLGAIAALDARPGVSMPVGEGLAAEPEPSVTGPLVRIIGLVASGGIVLADPTGGTADWDTPGIASGAPAYLFPDNDGVTVAAYDNVDGFRLEYSGEVTPIDASTQVGGPIYPGPNKSGSYWQAAQGAPADLLMFDLVDPSGLALGPQIVADSAFPLGSDGTGALLIRAPGGVYAALPDDITQVTTGEVLAIGPTTAYARECDADFVCSIWRIDRTTGGRVALEHQLLDDARADSGSLGVTGSSVSRDGGVAFVRLESDVQDWVVVDLAIGKVTAVPALDTDTAIVWDDAGSAMFLAEDILHVFDRSSGSVGAVEGVPPLKTFVVAPGV